MITKEQVNEAFRNVTLEENYNFLEDDLVLLAEAFVKAVTPEIEKEERAKCVEIARSVNHLVAERIEQVRSQQ
jgi:hypothetical protein